MGVGGSCEFSRIYSVTIFYHQVRLWTEIVPSVCACACLSACQPQTCIGLFQQTQMRTLFSRRPASECLIANIAACASALHRCGPQTGLRQQHVRMPAYQALLSSKQPKFGCLFKRKASASERLQRPGVK